jgi:arginase family enzyme
MHQYVAFPRLLRIQGSGEATLTIVNPDYAKEIALDAEQAEPFGLVLDAFSKPRTLADFHAQNPEAGEELINELIAHHFLVRADELEFLEGGFIDPAATPIGEACTWWDLDAQAQPGRWCVMGAPVDMAAGGKGGARHGPVEIRRAYASMFTYPAKDLLDFDYRRVYRDFRIDAVDLGDVAIMGANLALIGRRLEKALDAALDRGLRPIVLGGDHSITHFALRALSRHHDRIGILHFDAHPDLQAHGGVTHASVFRHALDNPKIALLLQMGLRGFQPVPEYAAPVRDPRLSFISARDLSRGALERIEELPTDIPYYLSVDVDAFDVPVAETGTPKLGGIAFRDASDIVDFAARKLRVIGADFVEVAQGHESVNAAAGIVANLMLRLMLGGCAFEAVDTHFYRYPR